MEKERKKIFCYASSVLICTLAYLFEKHKIFPKKEISNVISSLINDIKVLPVDLKHIESAIIREGIDFEDKIQTACAEEYCDCIVTINKKHFKNSTIQVYTPEEFLTELFSE